jgi:tRNA A58 N-methylase Trm61
VVRVKPSPEDWDIAGSVYRMFANKPGSGHIASEYSLAHISAVVRTHHLRSVLEFGAGIGTITYLLLRCLPSDRVLVSTEHNPYCLEQLRRNVPLEMRNGFSLCDRDEIDGRISFDLVIVDGKTARVASLSYLRPGTVCIVDGHREATRKSVQSRLAEHGSVCDFEYHAGRARRFDWRKTSSGFPYPRINWSPRPTRGCWIGKVS